MTVSSTLNKQVFPGNGATTVFNFSFAFPGGTPTQEAANFQVFYTDALGNVSLIAPTAYTLVLNPPTGTDPTPVGGSVTYSPVGGPIALGTFLTVFRNLTFDQATSLANQQTLYQQVIEAALDYQVMLSQQVVEVENRALVVPVSDPTPNPLPAVAQRAGLILGFDSNGNPVAVNAAPAGVISAPMIPVVGASTLAQARTNMGLGTIATESIGLGLADNGAGAVQIVPPLHIDSTNITLTINDHTSVREVNGGTFGYTLPLSSTLFSGFYFTIYNRGFATTVSPNAADSFDGMSTGTSQVLPAGACTTFITNGAGTWYVFSQANVLGNGAPTNCEIVSSVAGGALTIALKDRNGHDPSPASPILFQVSNAGIPVQRAIVAPLSITVPSGGTLGTANGFWARIWIAIFDNAGVPVLAVYQSASGVGSNNSTLIPWQEWNLNAATAVSAGSNSSGTWYGSTSVASANIKIVGYIEVDEPTAGSWTNAPSVLQLFGPGIKKPGDVIQCVTSITNSASLASLSPPNFVEYQASVFVNNNGTPANVLIGASAGNLRTYQFGTSAGGSAGTISFGGFHQANASSDTYTVSVAANNTLNASSIALKEIQS